MAAMKSVEEKNKKEKHAITITVRVESNDEEAFTSWLKDRYGRAVIIWDGATFSIGAGESKTITTSWIGIRNGLTDKIIRSTETVCQDGSFECCFKPYSMSHFTPVRLDMDWIPLHPNKKSAAANEKLYIEISELIKEAYAEEKDSDCDLTGKKAFVRSHCKKKLVDTGQVSESTLSVVLDDLLN
jgi:hypothetical protein